MIAGVFFTFFGYLLRRGCCFALVWVEHGAVHMPGNTIHSAYFALLPHEPVGPAFRAWRIRYVLVVGYP